MGRLNKTLMEPAELLQAEGRLFNALARLESGELEGYLRGLLTGPELEMLTKRIALLRLLSLGRTQADIADKLKLSKSTISQMSNRLRYDPYLQKLAAKVSESA